MKSAPNHMIHELKKLWPMIQKHGITNLWVFGSHARGDFMGLEIDLEDRLGTKVDLLSRSACGTRFLKAIQPELLHVA